MALHGGLSFCKTQQVVGFDCAGIERLSVPQPNSCLLLGEPIYLSQRSLPLGVAIYILRKMPRKPEESSVECYGHGFLIAARPRGV